jgi:hypothetical protein
LTRCARSGTKRSSNPGFAAARAVVSARVCSEVTKRQAVLLLFVIRISFVIRHSPPAWKSYGLEACFVIVHLRVRSGLLRGSKRRTSNIKHRSGNCANWTVDVGCSVFDVCFCLLQVEESPHSRRNYIQSPHERRAEASRHTPDLLSPNTTTMTSRPGREPLAIKQCPAASV